MSLIQKFKNFQNDFNDIEEGKRGRSYSVFTIVEQGSYFQNDFNDIEEGKRVPEEVIRFLQLLNKEVLEWQSNDVSKNQQKSINL